MSPQDVIDVLEDVREFLHGYMRAKDTTDTAVALLLRVEEASAAIQREQDRVNNEH